MSIATEQKVEIEHSIAADYTVMLRTPFLKKPADSPHAAPIRSVLLITQYYPPEIGGGAQRSSGIAEELRRCGIDVTVVAPFATYLMRDPERATSWKLWDEQTIGGVRVIRSFVIAPDRIHMMKRILYYVSFAISACINGLLHAGKADAIIVISPPLLTGITGVFLKKMKKTRLIFDVGDIWPESAVQLGFVKDGVFLRCLERLEKWIYRHSDAVNVVTRSTYERFQKLHPGIRNVFYIPNFVDTQLITKTGKDEALRTRYKLTGKTIFGYAGNIGAAQGITVLTDAAKLLKDRKDIVFLIIGDGIEASKIEREQREHGLENVIMVPPVPKEEMNQHLSLFDHAIIPLVKNELFRITIPSKMYECMAAEIPVILCVDGEARRVMEEAQAGVFVEPGNAVMLAETIRHAADHPAAGIEMGKNGRAYAQTHFDRKTVVTDLVTNLQTLPLQREAVSIVNSYAAEIG